MRWFLSSLVFLSLCGAIPITQNDLKDGSLVIRSPGEYTFVEDVVFAPRLPDDLSTFDAEQLAEPELFMFPTEEQREENGRAFNLGFYSALVIASDNVIIDLNGFTLSQSNIHAAMQRFFSLIELANSPFPSGKGPANFTTAAGFVAATNVTVRNGRLSKSIHHGIHGNNCKNLVFENLVIDGFEVAGISLNAADNVLFNNVTIENSRRDERYNGRISQVIFSLQALSLYIEPYINPILVSSPLASEIAETRAILRDILRKVIKFEVEMQVKQVSDNVEAVNSGLSHLDPIVRTVTNGLPDGSLLAGILMHASLNTGEFKAEFTDKNCQNIVFEDVMIRNLVARPTEYTGLSKEDKHLTDMIGAAVDIDAVRDLSSPILNYKSNALVDFQVLLTELRNEVLRTHDLDSLNKDLLRLFSRNGIVDEFIAWKKGELQWIDLVGDERFQIFPNADFMLHFNKGIIGIKIDQSAQVQMTNVKIENLENLATKADRSFLYQNLPLAGSSEFDLNIEPYLSQIKTRHYTGYAVRGVALAANVHVTGDVEISSLFSNFEAEMKQVDYINVNSDISIAVKSSDNICPEEPHFQGELATFDKILPYIRRDEFNSINLKGNKSAVISYDGKVGIVSFLCLVAIAGFVVWKLRNGKDTLDVKNGDNDIIEDYSISVEVK